MACEEASELILERLQAQCPRGEGYATEAQVMERHPMYPILAYAQSDLNRSDWLDLRDRAIDTFDCDESSWFRRFLKMERR